MFFTLESIKDKQILAKQTNNWMHFFVSVSSQGLCFLQSYMGAFWSSLILSDLLFPPLSTQVLKYSITAQTCSLAFTCTCFPSSSPNWLMEVIPDNSSPPWVSRQMKLSKYSMIWHLSVVLSGIYYLFIYLSNWQTCFSGCPGLR